ncbi:MAG: 3D domain-containing protein [Caulobacter sp.]|nr:3D domain-containing protein [Caulobacter sp.]
MKRILPCLAALGLVMFTPPAFAQSAVDPIADLIQNALQDSAPAAPQIAPDWVLKASLYHAGAPGVGGRDSLGCPTVAMRTAATDRTLVPRRTILFIKETVGMPMPDGSVHDGYWYASDVGGAIKGNRIDLFTGSGRGSMAPMMKLNMRAVTVSRAGTFEGCPRAGARVAAR